MQYWVAEQAAQLQSICWEHLNYESHGVETTAASVPSESSSLGSLSPVM